jgi:transposase
LKENLRVLWDFPRRWQAATFFRRWYFWARHSRLPPMIEVARLIKRHLHNVLTYYIHPLTNALAEGLNSKIAGIQKRACGFRNRDHFKIAVYFHCAGLSLYPSRFAPTIV